MIVVLPFLAIIEQNARVYRDVLGALDDGTGVVVEHHSAVQTTRDQESDDGEQDSVSQTVSARSRRPRIGTPR